MKKFFSMMVAVAAMFTFAACGGDEPAPQPQKPAEKTQLEAPVVTVKDVTETGFTIEWTAVANATEYAIYLNKDNKPTTTETSYTFTDLNAGTYKPRVMALGGENYENSEYSAVVEVNITGPTSVNWFTQTVALPEDSDELAARGINSSNTFLLNWKGQGVESLRYMYFHEQELPATDADIISKMEVLPDNWLAEVNTAEGVDLQFNDLAGGQKYILCALAIKGDQEFLAKNEIATNATQLTLGTQAWLGTWNASSPEIIEWGETGFNLTTEQTDFTLNITPYNEFYSNYVWVDGFSVLGAQAPAFGSIYHEKVVNADQTAYEYTGNYCLDIMCYETIGQIDDTTWAVWLPLCVKGNGAYTFVSGSFPGFTLTLNPTTGAVTCEAFKGTLSDNSSFEVKMMDIFALDNTSGQLGPLAMEDGVTPYTLYKAGGIQNVVKVPATPATSSVAPKAMKAAAYPSSVVIAK